MPRIQAPPASAVAVAVWTAATRTLTADPNPFTAIGARVNVAIGAVLDLRPGAGKFRLVSTGNANPDDNPGVYDGATFDGRGGAGLNPAGFGAGFGNSARGYSIRNNGAGAQDIQYAGFDRG